MSASEILDLQTSRLRPLEDRSLDFRREIGRIQQSPNMAGLQAMWLQHVRQ